MAFQLTWLPVVLRNAGLKVAEVDGWPNRGRSEMGVVKGVICHHTAGPRSGNMPSLGVLKNGRADLAGPLAQLGLGYPFLALLAAQHWRGNIRELRNVLEQAALHADSDRLDGEHMEAVLRLAGVAQIQPALPAAEAPAGADTLLQPLARQVRALEQRAIATALRATGGNKLAAARLLGISRATLYERLDATVRAEPTG